MSRPGRNSLLLLLIGVLLAGLSVSALAAEEGGEDEGSTESTSTTASGLSPAVPIEAEEGEPPAVDWTYRYIIPTGLALAGIIVLITAIKYFTDVVRKRYRVIE